MRHVVFCTSAWYQQYSTQDCSREYAPCTPLYCVLYVHGSGWFILSVLSTVEYNHSTVVGCLPYRSSIVFYTIQYSSPSTANLLNQNIYLV